MKQMLAAMLLALMLGPARPASAQSPEWPERIWFGVSGGALATMNGFSDAFDVPLNTERATLSIAYPATEGAILTVSGGYRVWRRLALGVAVTRDNRREPATVDARLPHPFFDNQFRAVQGTTPATRHELGGHLLVGWMMPITDRVRLLVTAGPSLFNVRQSLVTAVDVTETYPYDTATFKGAITKDSTASAAGFNAGVDVFWMFSRHVGAGGLVQITRARAQTPADGGRTVSMDAGGAQIGGGLRFVF